MKKIKHYYEWFSALNASLSVGGVLKIDRQRKMKRQKTLESLSLTNKAQNAPLRLVLFFSPQI